MNSVNDIQNRTVSVQFLLRTFDKDECIVEAIQALNNSRKFSVDLERKHFDRFEDAVTRAGAFLPRDQQMIQFVDGVE